MITVKKITDIELLRECIEFVYCIDESKMTEAMAYHQEHSIIRTQLFMIKMEGMSTKVSAHFVRHAATGQFHLVGSDRATDQLRLVGSNRGSWDCPDMEAVDCDTKIEDTTPVNHVMILNAGHLLDMAKRRLCSKAEKDTREVMNMIRDAMFIIDKDLARMMVPTCFYRGGICPEPNSCGKNVEMLVQMLEQTPEDVYRNARNRRAIAEEGMVIH